MAICYRVKVTSGPDQKEPRANGKDVLSDQESEGSQWQVGELTNRNRI